MDFESLLFVPNRLVEDYRSKLREALEDSEDVAEELKVPEIEKAESLEALGMSLFYQGDYQAAWKHLKDSLGYTFSASVRSSRRVCLCTIYLGLCSYKLSDIQAADDELHKAFCVADASHIPDLQALALINRCIVLIKKDVLTVAVTIAKQAIDILIQNHVCEKDSYQYRQYVYVLVLVYVKMREFHKAEVLVEETAFPERERVLLDAGLCMGMGKLQKAHNILHTAYTQLNPSSQQTNHPTQQHQNAQTNHSPTHGMRIGEAGSEAGDSGNSLLGEEWAEGLAVGDDDEPGHVMLDRYIHKIQIVYNLSLINQMHLTKESEDLLSEHGAEGGSVSTYSVHTMAQNHAQHLNMLRDLIRITKGVIYKLYQQYVQRTEGGLGLEDIPFYHSPSPYTTAGSSNNANSYSHPYMPMECMYRALSVYGILCFAYAESMSANESWSAKSASMVQTIGVKASSKDNHVINLDVVKGLDGYDENWVEKSKDIEKYFQKSLMVYDLLKVSGSAKDAAEEGDVEENKQQEIAGDDPNKVDSSEQNADNAKMDDDANKAKSEEKAVESKPAGGSVGGSICGSVMGDDLDSVLSNMHVKDVSNLLFNPDIMLIQDYVRNMHLFASLSTMHTVPIHDLHTQMNKVYTKLSNEAANVIKLHGVDFNPQTGIVQNNRGGGGVGKNNAANNKAALAFNPPTDYVSEKIDGVTRMSEFMGMSNRLGRDEVGGWITWALANCYMVSMGYLGTSCLSGGEFQKLAPNNPANANNTAHNANNAAATNNPQIKTPPAATAATAASSSLLPSLLASTNQPVDSMFADPPPMPNPSLLIEIRNRLLELNLKLSFTYEHDDVYQFNELEMRICCIIILIKITTMLHMKTDIPSLLIQLLKAVDVLYSKKPCPESCAYVCIANKFKCEYEDWLTTPFMSNIELAHHYTAVLLPLYRKYMKSCEHLPSDVYGEMRKDAYKKMMNIYTLIYKCSVSTNDGGHASAGAAGKANNTNSHANKSSNVSVGSHSSSISKDKNFTDDEVMHMDEATVEEFEGDERWVMRYGKVRAMVYFKKMKMLIVQNV